MKKIIRNFKYIKVRDILDVFKLIIFLPVSIIYRLYLSITKKQIWLIIEGGKEACDNGYHLFRYIRENHPSDYVYYVIDDSCVDKNNVEPLGNTIAYRSVKHWIYYLSAKWNISTQKSGNPSPSIFYFIHVILGLLQNRIFLQHGITKDDALWLYYKNTKFRLFVCGAKKEYEYVKEKFGYEEKKIAYLGFTRFDALTISKTKRNQWFLFPTWRNWLGRETNVLGEKIDFKESNYFIKYQQLLKDKRLLAFLEKENITLYFMPHQNMNQFENCFTTTSKNIKIVNPSIISVQQLMITSGLMITDYSSAIMDFSMMKKPVFYYQFDYDIYRDKQLKEGYFSYKENGFGPICEEKDDLVEQLIKIHHNNTEMPQKYKDRVDVFFPINDQNNSERTYNKIKTMRR